MGDTVNLAARMMGVAGKGQIRCEYETYRKFKFRSHTTMRVLSNLIFVSGWIGAK